MARVTINKINRALEAAGFVGVELVRGNGYFYFASKLDAGDLGDNEPAGWYESGVYVFHLTDYTVNDWVQAAIQLKNETLSRRY